jgi:putative protease
MKEQEIGYISNYFKNINVAIIEMTKGSLKTGDTVHFKGKTTDFTTTVSSMQIEHEQVEKVKKNDSLGLKVSEKVRKTDKVFKVID